jgi:hypothetical protein
VVGCQRDAARFTEERSQLDALVLELAVEDCNVGRAFPQTAEGVEEAGEVDRHLDLGLRDVEALKCGCDQTPRERRDVPDDESGSLLAGGACGDHGVLGICEKGLGVVAQGFAGPGQLDAAGVPLDQPCADAILELTYLAAERLLG